MTDLSVTAARCVLFAYHEMGYACMEALLQIGAPVAALYTHSDQPGEEIWWRSCVELANREKIPVLTVEKFDAQQISQISALEPALIYSFYYRNLLPDEVLRLATIGAFNLHGSLLPKYRGRAPVNWVLVNGEHETGVTLHQMVARADAGELVAQRAIPIHDTDTALTLYRKLVPLGAEVIGTYHPQLVAGRAPRRPQDLSQGSYYGRRTPEDGRVDWSWPARRIFNLVRAVTHPYPGAFCSYRGQKLFIWQASIAHESASLGEAGQILRILGDDVEVAAGDGSVLVSRAQLESGDEAAAAVVFDSGVAPDAKLK